MILILGDTHGNFREFQRKFDSAKLEGVTVLHVGDFGIGFKNTESKEVHFLQELNSFLKKRNSTMYAIRGNHDNPKYFNGEYSYSNLKLVKDYTVLELEGQKFLMMGGAISVDRSIRIEEELNYNLISYWKDENFKLEYDILLNLKCIDNVVTHSAPSFVPPLNDISKIPNSHGPLVENYAKNDKNLKLDLIKERSDISTAYSILIKNNKIKNWYYGHFHFSNTEEINGVKFRLLSISELIEHK